MSDAESVIPAAVAYLHNNRQHDSAEWVMSIISLNHTLQSKLEAAEARIEAVRKVCDAWMAGSAPSAIKDVLAALTEEAPDGE